jgi:hypothetical protein
MNHAHSILFAEDITEDDEIDELFSQLQQIAPPATLIEDILASVARLSVPTPSRTTQKLWDDMGLVAYNIDQDPF